MRCIAAIAFGLLLVVVANAAPLRVGRKVLDDDPYHYYNTAKANADALAQDSYYYDVYTDTHGKTETDDFFSSAESKSTSHIPYYDVLAEAKAAAEANGYKTNAEAATNAVITDDTTLATSNSLAESSSGYY